MMFDLNLISLSYTSGQLQDETPGFYAARAPKRSARGRQEDSLIIFLTLKGSKLLSPQSQTEWLKRLSSVFFKTSGSVTSAMRVVIDTLNVSLLERNLKLVEDRDRISAYLNLAVIHHDTLFISQCGITHALLINKGGLIHFFDTDLGNRGLGLSRSPKIRYFQNAIDDGDYLIISPEPPESWNQDNLVSQGRPEIEQLWRRLHHKMPLNQCAGLIQLQAGEGAVNIIRPKEGRIVQSSSPTGAVLARENDLARDIRPPRPVTESVSPILKNDGKAVNAEIKQADREAGDSALVPEETARAKENLEGVSDISKTSVLKSEAVEKVQPIATENATFPKVEFEKAEDDPQTKSGVQFEKLERAGLKGLSTFFEWLHRAKNIVKTFFRDLIGKISPKTGVGQPKLSRGTMFFIAIAIPLLVVAIAVSVYVGRGKEQQYLYYFSQAQAAVANAQIASDVETQRSVWGQALIWADQASDYRDSEELRALITQAQSALDALDGAERLAFQPAIVGELYNEIDIRHIIALGSDLYLLDASQGRVIHLTLGGNGYEVDAGFICQAGQYSSITVGNLVDVVSIPINNEFRAPILAVDSSGNILYCTTGKEPEARSLITPDRGWGVIQSMAYDSQRLFLLDPSKNAIWVYEGNASRFETAPRFYFEGFPLDVSTVVDITDNGDELYMLHNDGHLASCIASGFEFAPIKCIDPEPYHDERVGVRSLNLPELQFNQVLYSPPPDPSIFLLAPGYADIYQFSLRLNLNRIYRPNFGEYDVEGNEATAFAIAANRRAFLAFSHQLFYAVIP